MDLHWLLPPLLRKSIALPVITKDFLSSVIPQKTEKEQDEVWDILSSMDTELIGQIKENTLLVRKHLSGWEDQLPAKVRNLHGLRLRLLGHGADGRIFPPVPNRWQIVRRVLGEERQRWIVESDYIHPSSFEPEFPGRYTTFPWLQAYDKGGLPPFRYIGRVVETENDLLREIICIRTKNPVR